MVSLAAFRAFCSFLATTIPSRKYAVATIEQTKVAKVDIQHEVSEHDDKTTRKDRQRKVTA